VHHKGRPKYEAVTRSMPTVIGDGHQASFIWVGRDNRAVRVASDRLIARLVHGRYSRLSRRPVERCRSAPTTAATPLPHLPRPLPRTGVGNQSHWTAKPRGILGDRAGHGTAGVAGSAADASVITSGARPPGAFRPAASRRCRPESGAGGSWCGVRSRRTAAWRQGGVRPCSPTPRVAHRPGSTATSGRRCCCWPD
jgi:hypothetical protein